MSASMPIGMFSRASSLSVKALRAYHELGVLVPAVIDERTGYRNYSLDQLADAAIIVRLRSLDIPLAQVREVIVARDPAVTAAVLARHSATMAERLAEATRIVSELQSDTAVGTLTPVHRRELAPTHTLAVRGRVSPSGLGPWLMEAYQRLAATVEHGRYELHGPSGALYPAEIIDDGPEPVEVYLPIAEPPDGALPDGVVLSWLPAAHVAVIVHAGGYDSIHDTYRTLGAWVARHSRPSGEAVREHYLVSPSDSVDRTAYRTEICWPILPA